MSLQSLIECTDKIHIFQNYSFKFICIRIDIVEIDYDSAFRRVVNYLKALYDVGSIIKNITSISCLSKDCLIKGFNGPNIRIKSECKQCTLQMNKCIFCGKQTDICGNNYGRLISSDNKKLFISDDEYIEKYIVLMIKSINTENQN